MATDDSAVFLASQDWLDEAELAQTPLKGVELILANASRVGWIRTKEIDRDLLDGEEAGAGHADLTREAATHSSRPSIGMRQAVNARPTPSGRATSARQVPSHAVRNGGESTLGSGPSGSLSRPPGPGRESLVDFRDAKP